MKLKVMKVKYVYRFSANVSICEWANLRIFMLSLPNIFFEISHYLGKTRNDKTTLPIKQNLITCIRFKTIDNPFCNRYYETNRVIPNEVRGGIFCLSDFSSVVLTSIEMTRI